MQDGCYTMLPLSQVDKFCEGDGTEYAHDKARPTKHNIMCDQVSVWEVIQKNADFQGLKPFEGTPPDTTFKIVTPATPRFVFVLDVSGSMAQFDKLNRLKQSAGNWLLYDVRNGTDVGIVTFRYQVGNCDTYFKMSLFSDEATVIDSLTLINDTASRKQLRNDIDALNPDDTTFISKGLVAGMKVVEVL